MPGAALQKLIAETRNLELSLIELGASICDPQLIEPLLGGFFQPIKVRARGRRCYVVSRAKAIVLK